MKLTLVLLVFGSLGLAQAWSSPDPTVGGGSIAEEFAVPIRDHARSSHPTRTDDAVRDDPQTKEEPQDARQGRVRLAGTSAL